MSLYVHLKRKYATSPLGVAVFNRLGNVTLLQLRKEIELDKLSDQQSGATQHVNNSWLHLPHITVQKYLKAEYKAAHIWHN
jgi:hypothetical protein